MPYTRDGCDLFTQVPVLSSEFFIKLNALFEYFSLYFFLLSRENEYV